MEDKNAVGNDGSFEPGVYIFLVLIIMLFWFACQFFLTGCGRPSYTLPCRIPGIQLEVVANEEQAHQRCRIELGSQPDKGRVYRRAEKAGGCADYEHKIIVIQESSADLWHEVEHFLKYFCSSKKK